MLNTCVHMFPCHLFLPWKTPQLLKTVTAIYQLLPREYSCLPPLQQNNTTSGTTNAVGLPGLVAGRGANHGKIDSERRPKHGHDKKKSIPALPPLHTLGAATPRTPGDSGDRYTWAHAAIKNALFRALL